MTPYTWRRWRIIGATTFYPWTKWHIIQDDSKITKLTLCRVQAFLGAPSTSHFHIEPGEEPPPEKNQCKRCLQIARRDEG